MVHPIIIIICTGDISSVAITAEYNDVMYLFLVCCEFRKIHSEKQRDLDLRYIKS